MSPPGRRTATRRLRRLLLRGSAARGLAAAAAAFAVLQALRLRLSYYDSWDYWNDARALLGESDAVYYRVHGPLEALLLSPLVATVDRDGLGPWIAPHLLHAGLAALTLVLLHGWLRPLVGPRGAAAGVLVFAATRLFVRYAPHALVDIPAAGWAVATFAAWDRADRAAAAGHARQAARWAVASGAALGAGMLHKYTLLALPGALGGAALLRAALEPGGLARLRRLTLTGLSCLGVFTLGFAGALWRAEGSVSFQTFLEVLSEAEDMVQTWGGEGAGDYVALALGVASPLTFALALGGLAVVLRHWRSDRVRRALPALLWLPLAGGLLALRVTHSEARYLLPLWPSLALLVGFAVRASVPLLRRAPGPSAVAVAVGLAAVAWPAISQARHDLHPAFARPTQPAFAHVLRQALLTPSRVLWRGHPVPLVTTPNPEAPALPDDEFFDFVHLAHPFVSALGERGVEGRYETPQRPVRMMMNEPGEVDLLVRGAPEVLYTPRLVEGAEAPAELELWLRSRWRFRAPGTLGGLRLDEEGRLHVEAPSPGLSGADLRAAGARVSTVGLAVDDARLPSGRVHDLRAAVQAAGPAGVSVSRVERVALPLLWHALPQRLPPGARP